MILENMLTYKANEEFIKSIEVADYVFEYSEPYSRAGNNLFQKSIDQAKWLGKQCFFNRRAIPLKARLIKSILNSMAKGRFYCKATLGQLYSERTPNYEERISKLSEALVHIITRRYQYLEAFNIIRKNTSLHDQINKQFFLDAEMSLNRFVGYTSPAELLEAYNNVDETDEYEGMEPTGKSMMTDFFINLRNESKEKIKLSQTNYTNEQLMYIWLDRREDDLSYTNLKRLGRLLVKAYKTAFISEIKNHRKLKKKEYDKNRYKPKKKFSKDDKSRLIKKYKNLGLSQRKIAEKMKINKSTVERNWHN